MVRTAKCRKGMFLGTVGLQANLVQTGRQRPTHPPTRAPRTHPPTHPGATHPPGRHPPTHPLTHPGATHPPGRHPPTHPPTRAPGMFLGKTQLQPNLVRTAGRPKTNLCGHLRALAQFGPNGRNTEDKCSWAHSGFRPIWSEQPRCRKAMFLGTFGFQANLVQTGRHPPTQTPTRAPHTHPPTHPSGRHPPTHPPTHPGGTNVFGHIRASAQFSPNSRNAENECFWAHSGFRPIVQTGRHPPTHPPTRAPPTHPTTQPGAENVFGHGQASAQFGPNSRNAENECFWAHSGFSPIWSEQPECRKPMFLGTFGLQANLVQTGHHPPTDPATRDKRIFLGTFGLEANLVPIARMPNTNVFGHIRASAQFGPNSQNAGYECFWAHSGFRPIESEQPQCQKAMFLGTFGFQANLVQTERHPPTHTPTRAPPAHQPTHPVLACVRPALHRPALPCTPLHCALDMDSYCICRPSAHSGLSPIWSQQPECRIGMFLGTFGLQANLVQTGPTHPPTHPTGRQPPTHLPSRAPPSYPPTHPGATQPPTHPGATHPPGRHPTTHPPTHPPTRAPPTQPPTRAPPTHPPEQPEC